MQTDDNYGKVRPRKPSFRGQAYAYVSGGEVRVAAWPAKRKRGHRSQLTEEQEWFRQAQWASKYWPAQMQAQCAEAVKGTPLMPRDIMTMIMAGRAFCWVSEDGWKVYSVAARNDVSESLDVISQYPGSMLFRNSELWVPITGGTPGYKLTYKGENVPPAWEPDTAPSGGADWVLDTNWEFAVDGPVPAVISGDLTGSSQVMVVGRSVSSTAGGWRNMQVSIDGGATYLGASGDYVSSSDSGVPGNEAAIFFYSTSNSAARTFWGTIEKINHNVAVRPCLTPQRQPTFILNAPTPINRVRVANWAAANNPVAGNLNGGQIQIYKR